MGIQSISSAYYSQSFCNRSWVCPVVLPVLCSLFGETERINGTLDESREESAIAALGNIFLRGEGEVK